MSQFDRLGNDMSDDIADALAWDQEDAERAMAHDTYPDELTGYEEHLRDSQGCGDPRRCPRHPHVATSSDDGMFDAPCGQCESEEEDAYIAWQHDPANPERAYCKNETYIVPEPRSSVACEPTEDDNIPF